MNFKKLIGIILFILGVILIIFSAYAKNRVHQAQKVVHEATGPFSGDPISKTLGGTIEKKAEQYDTTFTFSLVGGILLTIGGISMFLFFRKQ